MIENNYTYLTDYEAVDLAAVFPQDKHFKIYPYAISNLKTSGTLLRDNTISVIHVDQTPFEYTEYETNGIKQDDKGNKYMDAVLSVTQDTVLNPVDHTHINSSTLDHEPVISVISNVKIDVNKDSISFVNPVFSFDSTPMFYTIGRPLDVEAYHKGEQKAYIASAMETVQPGAIVDQYTIQTDGMYSFDLANLITIENMYTNAKIMVTDRKDLADITTDGANGNSVIKLSFDGHTIFSSIKGKGLVKYWDGDDEIKGDDEESDIDFIVKDDLTPIKFIPTRVDERTELFFPWWDYEQAMPLFFANEFKTAAGLSGMIDHDGDRHMLSDMLAVSAQFAEGFSKAPRLKEAGKLDSIDPDFRIGYGGHKAVAMAGKDPMQIVDGIYETYIREHPDLLTSKIRYLKLRSIMNALSRYIYSSYCIGRGGNQFNAAYLPWYLAPTSSIKLDSTKHSIVNPDPGQTGNVDTYILDTSVQFQTHTSFFSTKFGSAIPDYPETNPTLPTNFNVSRQITMQTDRKITIPDVPSVLGEVTTNTLPGDINTNSSDALSYIGYMKLQPDKWKEWMMETASKTVTSTAGEQTTISLPPLSPGMHATESTIKSLTALVYMSKYHTFGLPKIITPATAFVTWGEDQRWGKIHLDTDTAHKAIYDQAVFFGYMKKDGAKYLLTDWGIRHGAQWFIEQITGSEHVQLVSSDLHNEYHGAKLVFVYKIGTEHFTDATIELPRNTSFTMSTNSRQSTFSKPEWETFSLPYTGTKQEITLETPEGYQLKRINEITIKSVWGNSVDLILGDLPKDRITIPLFNKDDESIAEQTILLHW